MNPNGKLINANDNADSENQAVTGEESITSAAVSRMKQRSLSFYLGNLSDDAHIFSEMLSGRGDALISQVIIDSYDVLYGDWPASYDEVVIIAGSDGSLQAETFYQLGLLTADEYTSSRDAVLSGTPEEARIFSYEDICKAQLYMVPACDQYIKNEDGTFSYITPSTVVNSRATLLRKMLQARADICCSIMHSRLRLQESSAQKQAVPMPI